MKNLVILAAALAIAGCAAAPDSANIYQAYQTQREQSIRMATVEAVREVTINQGETGTGALAGASLGGIAAGANIGEGRGAVAAGIAGAVLGGIVGQRVERHQAYRNGLEITVRLDNGELRAITQAGDEWFRVGDRVRLLTAGSTTRVTH